MTMATFLRATTLSATTQRGLCAAWTCVTRTAGGIGRNSVLALTLMLLPVLSADPVAASDGVCSSGKNLLETLSADDLARIEAAAGATPNGKGLLWKIEREGTPPSWLYGTMHDSDPRVLALSDAARKGFGAADTVALELGEMQDLEAAASAFLSEFLSDPSISLLPNGATLSSLLEEDDLRKVDAMLSEAGIPMALMSRMQPWLLTFMISAIDCDAGQPFLDQVLGETAVAEGKTVVGLETIREQLMVTAGLPLETQLIMLIDTAAVHDQLPDFEATMTDLYISGEIAMIMPALEHLAEKAGYKYDPNDYAEFMKLLVDKRNRTMAERALPLITKGNAFIAVGALHLPGKEGLVELLRERGYRVTAVQ